MFEQLLLDEAAKYKTFLVGFSGCRGAGFAGFRVSQVDQEKRSGNILKNGFRGLPPAKILLTRYRSMPIIGTKILRHDAAWVNGRDNNPYVDKLAGKVVILFGAGSLGSSVAELLTSSGIGNIILVDPEALGSENIHRHLLGTASVGENKAKAISRSLASRFPHLAIEGHAQTWQDFAAAKPELLTSADLIISLIGEWSAESQLNALSQHSKSFPPIIYGWTEAFAAAGHALALFPKSACLRCLTDELGKLRITVTEWPEVDTLRYVPICGETFQPYGRIELTYIHGLIADLAFDIVLGQVTQSTHRVWIGHRKLVYPHGGKWASGWVERHGNPVAGGITKEIPVEKDAMCPECSQIGYFLQGSV